MRVSENRSASAKAHTNGTGPAALFKSFRFKDFEVTWAGPHPFGSGFCFGSEDGELRFTDENFTPLADSGRSRSGEAINGVARSGDWIAVSTRADVTMGNAVKSKQTGTIVLPCGVLGIVATPGGYFAAPMGHLGVMMVKAGVATGEEFGRLDPGKPEMYFHQVIALPGRQGKDLLVCATGDTGIGLTELRWGETTYNMRVAPFEDTDVVDVCSVDSDPSAPTVAALGRNGRIIMVRDARGDARAFGIKFNAIEGTAYRLLSSGGDFFVLTSRALYMLKNLASRLKSGSLSESSTTHILVVPMAGVDANLVGDRWLLVVTADEVVRGDLKVLRQPKPEDQAEDVGEESGEIEEDAPLLPLRWDPQALLIPA